MLFFGVRFTRAANSQSARDYTGLDTVTDTHVSGVIPLWIMTALRSVAVIGFLLASRLKDFSFNQLRDEWTQGNSRKNDLDREPIKIQIDYRLLARAIVDTMQQTETPQQINIEELAENMAALPRPYSNENGNQREPESNQEDHKQISEQQEDVTQKPTHIEEKLQTAYQALLHEGEKITGTNLSKRAGVRKQTALEWLHRHE
ncbi:hypothetical protein [Dictyobacter kobayashii]|nr:hypothetical protein [Dictyobacter kobayashii]